MPNFPDFIANLTPAPRLNALLNPPDLLDGTPGEQVLLSVVVQNEGDRNAVITAFINEDSDPAVLQWCRVSRQQLSLAPQQQEELVFHFSLPAIAAAATYDYLLVLDAPEDYPELPPLQYPLQLRVLFKEQTAIRAGDPTFFINPATNPQKPARLHPGKGLQFQVRVDNRSNEVDNYRLSCPDLEEDWFKIYYAELNLGEFGLVSGVGTLELNPKNQGIIQLEICPPTAALAGVYIPSIYLHSRNLPDLRRLDCIYFEIEQVETLEVELETLIGRISQTAGQYRLNLKNTGNVIRQLRFSASSRDEDEICSYRFDPPTVRLLPHQTAQVLLQVSPKQPKQRPFWGMGRSIHFQVDLQDADGYLLPDRSLQATLTWKARPWWQFVLLVLLVLGLLAGGVLLLRWLLRPEPVPEVAGFGAIDSGYVEGEPVQLEWTVRHPRQVRSMVITAKPPIQPSQITVDPVNCTPDPTQTDQIRCKEFVGALSAQKYDFVLNTLLQNGQSLSSQTEVTIAPKPPPAITAFSTTKTRYRRSEPVQLNWTIQNSDQLNGLTLIAIDAKNQSNLNIPLLRARTGQGIRADADLQSEAGKPDLKPLCQLSTTGVLSCNRVPISLDRAGDYLLKLQAAVLQPQSGPPRPPVESTPTGTITIQPQPLVLIASVNGEFDALKGIELGANQTEPLLLTWRVTGGEGTVQVLVQNNSQSSKSGTSTVSPPPPGQTLTITFVASDQSGNPPQQRSFTVTRRMPPSQPVIPRPLGLPPIPP